jgi:L-2-hydroxyglutarate oxidase LhgO
MVSKLGDSAYGKVTRNMVENLSNDFNNFKLDIKQEFKELRDTNTNLYNHLSSRVQPWVTVVLTIGSGLIVGLITWAVTK